MIESYKEIKTLDIISIKLEYGNIDLETDLMKNTIDSMTDEEVSDFIEAILLRLPIGQINFDGSDNDKWIVVSGQKLVVALYKFCLCNAKLTNTKLLKEFEGLGFKELPSMYKRRLNETYVETHILGQANKLKEFYHYFVSKNLA